MQSTEYGIRSAESPGTKRRALFPVSILFFLSSGSWLLASLFLPLPSAAAEISDITVRLANNELYVAASVKPDPKLLEELNEGLSKELVFYIDLFRVWNIWPDEFVLGKKITRIIKSNPIKREHRTTSTDGTVQLEKRFKELDAMVAWAMAIPEMKLTNVKELDPGVYFVKVTVESRIRRLPPVVGYLLPFLPEKEFSLSKNSPIFKINGPERP
ncbi:MAG: DUF4390 domain-containing protein [Nitrospirota bacterium]